MKLHTHLLFGTLALLPLVGCVDPESEILDADPEAELRNGCVLPLTPGTPPPGQSASVTSGSVATINVAAGSYGTAQCSRTTVEFLDALQVHISTPSIANNEADCENTQVFATFFYDSSGYGDWVREYSDAESGHWTGSSCLEPFFTFDVPKTKIGGNSENFPPQWLQLPRNVRAVVSSEKKTCTSSGLCGTSYGRAVRALGTR